MAHGSMHSSCIPVAADFDPAAYRRNARNIMVISPHPDDDVIGMGGTMRLLADSGCNLFSLYITDGSSRIFKNKNISLLRRQEALAGLRVVRACAGIFLNHKSTRLAAANSTLVRDIKDILCYFMPREIYLPSPLERHRTHLLATRAAVQAIRRIKNYHPQLWGYHVWGGACGLSAVKAVDITGVIAVKKRAVRVHTSQLAAKPYDSGIVARNHYEAVFLETHRPGRCKYAETFVDLRGFLVKGRTFKANVLHMVTGSPVL